MKPQYRIVLIYLLVGFTWIFFSDRATEYLLERLEDITLAQHLKGCLFVIVTGLLLFILIRRAVNETDTIRSKLVQSYDQTISGWVHVMDLRHQETKDHTTRVTRMTLALAQLMGIKDPNELKCIERGATLHDIGKIGIPDAILLKPGALTPEERAIINTHPQIADDLIRHIDFLKPCTDIPCYHHERWDGQGYPKGLQEQAIPLAARIFAVIDVWDALIHPRVYKSAWSEERVLGHLHQESGKHFDPEVVSTFIKHYAHIKQTAQITANAS